MYVYPSLITVVKNSFYICCIHSDLNILTEIAFWLFAIAVMSKKAIAVMSSQKTTHIFLLHVTCIVIFMLGYTGLVPTFFQNDPVYSNDFVFEF